MAEDLTRAERAEALANAVALITARRAGVDDEEFGLMIARMLIDFAKSNPARPWSFVVDLVGQLAQMGAYASQEWSRVAGPGPAEEWLKNVGAVAAQARTEVGS